MSTNNYRTRSLLPLISILYLANRSRRQTQDDLKTRSTYEFVLRDRRSRRDRQNQSRSVRIEGKKDKHSNVVVQADSSSSCHTNPADSASYSHLHEAVDDLIPIAMPPSFSAGATAMCAAFSNEQYNHPLDGAYENMRTRHSSRMQRYPDLKYPVFFSQVSQVHMRQAIERRDMSKPVSITTPTTMDGPIVDATRPPHMFLRDSTPAERLLLAQEP